MKQSPRQGDEIAIWIQDFWFASHIGDGNGDITDALSCLQCGMECLFKRRRSALPFLLMEESDSCGDRAYSALVCFNRVPPLWFAYYTSSKRRECEILGTLDMLMARGICQVLVHLHLQHRNVCVDSTLQICTARWINKLCVPLGWETCVHIPKDIESQLNVMQKFTSHH